MTSGTDARLVDLIAKHQRGALATIKRDGRPQLSTILYVFDRETRTARVSVTEDRAKTKNIRRDPRVSLYVTAAGGWSYAVGEGLAELTVEAADPNDATVEQLVAMYREAQGEHPDWDEFRQAMVSERRVLLTITLDRFYGAA